MPLEKIVVDATALLSAAMRGRALKIFLNAPIGEFLTTAFMFGEALGHLPAVCSHRRIPLIDAEAILHTLPILVHDRHHYRHTLEDSKRLIGARDERDVELLALGLREKAPIWTNDPDFRIGAVTKLLTVYSTTDLLRLLDI